ncbi:hypothetical protein EVG20_g4846 [Dentipellis fragilis]|uniref:Uncharacterized protein n=1 Tax=Dentipellis fragilis TaxID=205917 RepID=A0A4Y9YUZ0_9AGAM|nr:hypothetical protein EVG20_g4846 [Dentipellis fragilis]
MKKAISWTTRVVDKSIEKLKKVTRTTSGMTVVQYDLEQLRSSSSHVTDSRIRIAADDDLHQAAGSNVRGSLNNEAPDRQAPDGMARHATAHPLHLTTALTDNSARIGEPLTNELLSEQTTQDNDARIHDPAGDGDSESLTGVVSAHQSTRDEINIRKVLKNAARLILKTIRDASDAYPPLKSATGGICSIIDSIDVMNDNVAESARLIGCMEYLLGEHVKKWATRTDISSEMKNAMNKIKRDIESDQDNLEKNARTQGYIRFIQGASDATGLKNKDIAVKKAYEEFDHVLLESIKEDVTIIKKGVSNIETEQDNLTKKQNMARLESLFSHTAPFTAGKTGINCGLCTDGTRINVLEQIYDWILLDSKEQLFWLTGHAGSGKTTIAYTVCDHLMNNCSEISLVSYFCSRQLDSGASEHLIPSLCCCLAQYNNVYANSLAHVLGGHIELVGAQLGVQMQRFLVEPWSSCSFSAEDKTIVVVIDALDENTGGFMFLDQLLTAVSSGKMTGLKFLITSRTDQFIATRCQNLPKCRLQDIPTKDIKHDIVTYLNQELDGCDPALLDDISQKANGLFIYAATIVRITEPQPPSARDQTLHTLLIDPHSVIQDQDSYPPIYTLYLSIIEQWMEKIKSSKLKTLYLAILYTVICAQAPLSAEIINNLVIEMVDNLHIAPYTITHDIITAVINDLHAVLWVDNDEVIYWYHASFQDFILNDLMQMRSEILPKHICDPALFDTYLAQSCFGIMENKLHFNMCNLESSYKFDAEVMDLKERVTKCIEPVLHYSCLHWGSHFVKAMQKWHEHKSLLLLENMLIFGKKKVLFWIEVMNLLQAKRECYSTVDLVRVQLMKHDVSNEVTNELKSVLHAVKRLTSSFTRTPAALSTPHLYISCLATEFAITSVPEEWRQRFQGVPRVQCHGVSNHGMLVIIHNQSSVKAVAFSSDGNYIVSGSNNGTVQTWDAQTGTELIKINGHIDSVNSVMFSSDGKYIVSGSDDKTICIWEAQSGAKLNSMKEHLAPVNSVAFSPDGKYIVSGSRDTTIHIWDTQSGAEIRKIDIHKDWVNSVVFLPDGKYIVSGSEHATICIWDAQSDAELSRMKEHIAPVTSVAFSSDGKHIVSGSDDTTIHIWDAQTGAKLSRIIGHFAPVNSVAFSPNGKYIVSGHNRKKIMAIPDSENMIISIWDAQTGAECSKISGRFVSVNSVAFSFDGRCVVSGLDDGTICIWEAQSDAKLNKRNGHFNAFYSVKFSSDGKHILSDSFDRGVCIWDAQSGAEIRMLEMHMLTSRSLAVSPDGKCIVSGSPDKTICIWDAQSGAELSRIKGHIAQVNCVAFSPDGNYIVSGSDDKTIRIWEAQSGAELNRMKGHIAPVKSVAFSPDGRYIASGSNDGTVQIWDAQSGAELSNMGGHIYLVKSVAFSPDGKHIASGSYDKTVRIWDAQTGAEISMMNGHTDWVESVAFSPDGRYIVSGSSDKTICIWDAQTTTQPSMWHLDGQGWVHRSDPTNEHLMYIAAALQDTVCIPPCKNRISQHGSTTLDFTTACMGEQWSKCYTSDMSI